MITMSMNSLGKRLDSLDNDDSELESLEEMGPMSIAIVEGKPIRPVPTGQLEVQEMGPMSMAILAGKPTRPTGQLEVQEVGPISMAILTGNPTGPTRQEVNGKEGVPVPQPRPRKKPQPQEAEEAGGGDCL